mgnify:CR=1 FL=1
MFEILAHSIFLTLPNSFISPNRLLEDHHFQPSLQILLLFMPSQRLVFLWPYYMLLKPQFLNQKKFLL